MMKKLTTIVPVMLMFIAACLLCAVPIVLGCASATRSQLSALGHDHSVKLYSGGKLVGEWTSSGKVLTEEGSDGYYFTDKETKQLVRVSGDLIITPVD